MSASTTLYVGFTFEARGRALNSSSDCPITTSWWVCDAPTDSAFYSIADDGCAPLIDGADVAFTPDRRGTYRLTFRGESDGGQTSESLTVTAEADLLFMEVTYQEGRGFEQLVDLTLVDDACARLGEVDCGAAAPDCEWLPSLEICWTHCAAHTTQADCEAANTSPIADRCAWTPGDPPTCGLVYPPEKMQACYLRPESTCGDLQGCAWLTDVGFCGVDCASYAADTTCPTPACQWIGYCRSGLQSVPMPTPAQVLSDGSDLAFLRTDPVGFRYDPNHKFPEPNTLGAGLSAAGFGMSYLPTQRAAVLPYFYLAELDDPTSDIGTCVVTPTLLYWQQGASPGVPNVVEDLTPLVTDWSDPQLVRNASLPMFPNVAAGANGVLVAYGLQTFPDSSAYDACSVENLDYYQGLYSDFAATAREINNLAVHLSSPLWLARISDTEVVRGPLQAEPGVVPCEDDVECGLGTLCDLDVDNDGTPEPFGTCRAPCGGAGDCGGRACDADGFCKSPCLPTDDCGGAPCGDVCVGTAEVYGYLPKLNSAGAWLTYSQTWCPGDPSGVCDNDTRQADLVVGALEERNGAFWLTRAQLITATPDVQELDSVVVGDLGTDASIFYLALEQTTETLLTNGGTRTLDAPMLRARLDRRLLLSQGSSWAVAPVEDQVPVTPLVDAVRLSGSELPTPSFECHTGPFTDISTNLGNRVPMHMTVSPSGTQIAYAGVIIEYGCENDQAILLERPIQGDIFLIDMADPTLTPRLAYPDACRASLGDLSLMPRFIAGGQQLVFTNAAADGSDEKLFRLNLTDVPDPAAPPPATCPLVQVKSRSDVQAELQRLRPDLTVSSVSMADSRSYYDEQVVWSPGGACRGGGAGVETAAACALALALALRRRRRRGARCD